jgi:uncharacterized protein YceH (UPF0502 family)
VPEAIELYIPNKEVIHRARVQWRSSGEMGIAFDEEVQSPSAVPDAGQGDLATRVQALEAEVASLKRAFNEFRSGIRKHYGEIA